MTKDDIHVTAYVKIKVNGVQQFTNMPHYYGNSRAV